MKVFRWLLSAVAACILLVGCASNRPTKFKTENSNGVQDGVSIGYRSPSARGVGYYALIDRGESDVWRIVKFSDKPVARYEKTQEILFISENGQWVQPAFDFKVASEGISFTCSAFKNEDEIYSPCGSTRFSTTDVATTIFRNGIITPITWGLAAGTNRSVDSKAVFEAMTSTGLIEKAGAASSAQRQAKDAINELTKVGNGLTVSLRKQLIFDE